MDKKICKFLFTFFFLFNSIKTLGLEEDPLGVFGTYFNDKNLGQEVLSRVEKSIDFDWRRGSPHSKVGVDKFSARFSTFFEANKSGKHTFIVGGDDGYKLIFEGEVVIDGWEDQSFRKREVTISLEKGKRYPLVLEYYENGWDARLNLSFREPGRGVRIVPPEYLFRREKKIKEEYSFPFEGEKTQEKLDEVSTFNSISLYWKPILSEAKKGKALVRYRNITSQGPWKQGLDLWFDERSVENLSTKRSKEFRGSIVGLSPNSKYEIEVLNTETRQLLRVYSKTWPENFPISKTIEVSNYSEETLEIKEVGSPDGYVLVTGKLAKPALIDVKKRQSFNIVCDCKYVILRGFVLKGATDSGVLIKKGSHDLVVERNQISEFGDVDQSDGWALDHSAGVRTTLEDQKETKRIVIRDNKIFNPSFDSNNWTEKRVDRDTYHPIGAHGVILWQTGGNNVISYNTITSYNGNYFNDGLGGGKNFSEFGFPGKDSDIHNNSISRVWDDAIEAEGGNQNVRIYNNFTSEVKTSFGISSTQVGPLYIFRNITERHKYSHLSRHKFGNTGVVYKAQSKYVYRNFWGGGRVYIYHNTHAANTDLLSAQEGVSDVGKKLVNTIAINNIFETTLAVRDSNGDVSNIFDHNLYSGRLFIPRVGENNIRGRIGLNSDHSCLFCIEPGNLGIDQALFLPNISAGFKGDGPDVGAREYGTPNIKFGSRFFRGKDR